MNVSETLHVAIGHHQAGRLAEAEALYRQILAVHPQQPDALNFLGVIAHHAGRLDDAVAMISEAIAVAPNNPAAHSNLGNVLRDQGRLDEAIAAYRRALDLQPGHAEAHNNLGSAFWGKGRLDEAIAAFRQALELKPELAEAHYSLGNALRRKGQTEEAIGSLRRALQLRPDYADAHGALGAILAQLERSDEAIVACRRAVQLRPDFAQAHNSLGIALRGSRRLGEAIASYRRALQLRPDFAEAYNNLANALRDDEQLDAAIAAYRKAIEIAPEYGEAYGNLANALKEKGLLEEAIAALRTAARLRPDVPAYGHLLAAFTGDQSTASTPAGYVRDLFDEYAWRFDAHLVGKLGYRTPKQLYAAVTAMAPGRRFDVLDVGCGTGLCGVVFRAVARSLAGIDLAPKMIAKAAERGIYDRLVTGEVVAAMEEEQAGSFDLIVAGDVFVYVGDLAGVFGAASRVLREGGVFAFSVERQDEEGFALRPSARFAHSLSYLRALSRDHAFIEDLVQEVILRQDGGKDVAGLIAVLHKPSAAVDGHPGVHLHEAGDSAMS